MKSNNFVTIIFLICLNLIALNADAKNNTYTNKTIGIQVTLPENWLIFQKKAEAPEYFKPYFTENKGPNDSPLFLGATIRQEDFVRCLIDKTPMTLADYFDATIKTTKHQNLVVTSSKFNKAEDTLIWIFEMESNNVNLKFYEVITRQGEYILRLGFWTLESLFDLKLSAYKAITKNVQFLNNKKWESAWTDLNKNLQDRNLLHNETTAVCFEIKGKQNTVFLMGSIHVGKSSFYPFTSQIENAFRKSKYLVVELNILKDITKQQILKTEEYAKLDTKKTIEKIIPKDLYVKLVKKCTDFQLDIDKLEHYKPWYLALLLEIVQFAHLGYTENMGVDQYFLKKKKTDILELETFEQQMEIFEKIDGQMYLEYVLNNLDSAGQNMDNMIRAWKDGDTSRLKQILFSENETKNNVKKLFNHLFYNRNKLFSRKILTYLESDEDYFVIMGAGHLVGSKSVVELIKKKGYTVTQMKK